MMRVNMHFNQRVAVICLVILCNKAANKRVYNDQFNKDLWESWTDTAKELWDDAIESVNNKSAELKQAKKDKKASKGVRDQARSEYLAYKRGYESQHSGGGN